MRCSPQGDVRRARRVREDSELAETGHGEGAPSTFRSAQLESRLGELPKDKGILTA
jgi:hypothetical protein